MLTNDACSATPPPSLTFPRNRLLWLVLLLAVHTGVLVWAASFPLAIERNDYQPAEFVIVLLSAFVLAILVLTLLARHTRAVAVVASAVVAAILVTPGAVAVVLLCLLSAFVLGTRLLRFVRGRGRATVPDAVLPWPIATLIGIAVWIGLVCATASFKIHYAPYYAALLLVPLAFARRDTLDALARVRALLNSTASPFSTTERAWIAMLFAVVVLHLLVVARPDVGYDANAMHLQVALLVNDAHRWRFDVDRFAWAVMPLGADWAYTVAYVLGGENAARFANLCFAGLACACAYELVRRHARREWALASVTLLASIPLAFAETSSLYVENLWTAFLLGALLVTLHLARGSLSARVGWPALALLAAGAMQCKVIAVVWLAPLLVYALIGWLRQEDRVRPTLRSALLIAGAVAIAAWPYVNAWIRTGNPVFPFLNAVFQSPLADTVTSFTNPMYLTPLRPWSFYEMLTDAHRFIEGADGAAGLHWLLLIPLILVAFTRRRPLEQWLCLALAATFFAAVFMQQAYLRYLLPFFVLLAVLGGWAAADLPHGRVTRSIVLIAGGSLCVLQATLMHTGSWPNAQLCLRCAFDERERIDFVAHYMPDRIVGRYLTETLPDARVGFLMLNAPSPAGFTGYSRAANWHDNGFFYGVAYASDAADIAGLAAKYGLTHVVYRTNSPNMETAAIREFRETRVTPIWKFQDYVVAAIAPET